MLEDRNVLEHLLEGRGALVREVQRLTAALSDLDAVIGQLGGTSAHLSQNATSTARGGNVSAANGSSASRSSTSRRASGRAVDSGESGSKSIRVHVLEMLAAEDREFGLAEIIDRVHETGIQAHDDAVRSITTKLMKDGKVERVGRGQYRLARRRSAVRSAPLVDVSAGTNPLELTPEVAGATAVATASDAGTPTYTPPLNLGRPWEDD